MLESSNRAILLYSPRNSWPASVLWYVTFPAIASIRTRSFDLIKFKYNPDCAKLMLQWDIIFVLPVGVRNSLRICAMISNLPRFLSEIFVHVYLLFCFCPPRDLLVWWPFALSRRTLSTPFLREFCSLLILCHLTTQLSTVLFPK